MAEGVTIPKGAIGHVGMVAMLQRVRDEDVGRLVAVRYPVGYISSLSDSVRPTFAWQVLLLGDAIDLNGKECREITVADRCLKPVSQIEPERVAELARLQAVRDFDAALEDLRQLMTANPHAFENADNLDGMVERAAQTSLIKHALEVVPVAVALQGLDFRQSGKDSAVWHWSGVHLGRELYVFGGPDMFGRWSLTGRCISARELMWDERVLRDQEPRGEVARQILSLWREAFGRAAPVPSHLEFAQMYEQHLEDLKPLRMGLPTLHLDGEVFRATRRWIAQRHGLQDGETGPLPDLPLMLSHRDGLLRMKVAGEVYGCPARGVWVDDCSVSLRAFNTLSPWRLRGRTIRLERSLTDLLLRGDALAVW